MAKKKTVFMCQECGYESSGWLGKCPACLAWNTFVEQIEIKSSGVSTANKKIEPMYINDVKIITEQRFSTGMKELDRVLGGGMVPGSLILVGGDPGIGKSTLLLQICDRVEHDTSIFYVSGEESISQIKLRAERLDVKNDNILIVSEVNFKAIEELIVSKKPEIVIIDSIQTIYNDELTSAPGSVSQVREVTLGFMRIAKDLGVTIILVGHVTKEGAIAGPRVLEHMVDTVLYFEGEKHLNYRVLRAVKNRFGSTNEIGIFEMKDSGLMEIDNPSSVMLSGRPGTVPGSVVVSSLEGTRPMLIEVQALVCFTNFGMPRRMATGIDYNRITLLMAVLEKRAGMQMNNFDAYVNIVGGIRVDEPACDLGVLTAIASSFKNKAVDINTCLVGEVGLTGEVRAVSQIDKRVIEAERMGFNVCIIPDGNKKSVKHVQGISIKPVENIHQVMDILF